MWTEKLLKKNFACGGKRKKSRTSFSTFPTNELQKEKEKRVNNVQVAQNNPTMVIIAKKIE